MINFKYKETVQWIISRVFVLFFGAILIVHAVVNIPHMVTKAKLKALNRIRPSSFSSPQKFQKDHLEHNPKEMEQYVLYYDKVAELLVNKADVKGLQGYYAFYSGNRQRAEKYYQQAADMNPAFFWFHYNLGVIYFEAAEYEKAAESFRQAVAQRMDVILVVIKMSPMVYGPNMIAQGFTDQEKFPQHLKDGYFNAFKGLVLSQMNSGNYNEALTTVENIEQYRFDGNEEFYYYAGIISQKQKQYQRAISFFQQALKGDMENVSILEALANISRDMGNIKIFQQIQQRIMSLKVEGRAHYFSDKFVLGLY